MNKSATKFFSHTHYGFSTLAAVLYAVAWMIGNNVRAETNEAVLSPVVVTAKRVTEPAMLDAIYVTARREQSEPSATLAPVYVLARRDAGDSTSGSLPTIASTTPVTSQQAHAGVTGKVRNWLLATLIK